MRRKNMRAQVSWRKFIIVRLPETAVTWAGQKPRDKYIDLLRNRSDPSSVVAREASWVPFGQRFGFDLPASIHDMPPRPNTAHSFSNMRISLNVCRCLLIRIECWDRFSGAPTYPSSCAGKQAEWEKFRHKTPVGGRVPLA